MPTDANFLSDLRTVPWVRPRFPWLRKSTVSPEETLAAIYRGEESTSLHALNLTDQGDKLENAVLAIPFLVRLLPLVDNPRKVELLDLLVHLAIGWEDECLGPELVQGSFHFEEVSYSLVHRGMEQYLELLDSDCGAVRLAACRTLAWFPRSAHQILPRLQKLALVEASVAQEAVSVARGLLLDPKLPLAASPEKARFISNTAKIFRGPLSDENLQLAVEFADWCNQVPVTAILLPPFELDLALWTAEAIGRHSQNALRELVTVLPGGLLLDRCRDSLSMHS